MLGRGALANPLLSRQVARELGIFPTEPSVNPDGEFDWYLLLQRDRLSAEAVVEDAATRGTFTTFDAIKRASSIEEVFLGLKTGA
jgi:hypothetical protein